MSDLIDRIHRKVFQTRILRKTHLAITADPNQEPADIPIEYLDVGVIIMSRDTHMEVMKQDYTNYTGGAYPQDKSQPHRMFGIRIAFDDSIPFGEVLVAGDVV
jgi:hypothetical protein